GALAAANGLVVHPAAAADHDVVHRALAGGGNTFGVALGQRTEADVGYALGDLDVAGANGHRWSRSHDRARFGDDRDRAKSATVGGDGGIGHSAHCETNSAHCHRLDRVDIALALRVGACEVEDDVVTLNAHCHHDASGTLLFGTGTGRIHHILERPRA